MSNTTTTTMSNQGMILISESGENEQITAPMQAVPNVGDISLAEVVRTLSRRATSNHSTHDGVHTDPISPTQATEVPLAAPQGPATVTPTTLNEADLTYREEREKTVSLGDKVSIRAAIALHEIKTYHDGVLWQGDHKSFHQYCRKKWNYSKSHSYRLVEIGRIISELAAESPKGDWRPKNEWQIRPVIEMVLQERRVECWKHIVKKCKPAERTGTKVKELALKFAKDNDAWTRKPRTEITVNTKALNEVQKLQDVLSKLPNPERFNQILTEITTLIMTGQQAVEAGATASPPDSGVETASSETASSPPTNTMAA